MSAMDLSAGLPDALSSLEALYLLGVGGPEDAAGLGDVSAFVWRFAMVQGPDGRLTALGFSTMPRLMAFTRAVNGRQPFAVPTEVLRIETRRLGQGAPVQLILDPDPDDFQKLTAAGRLVERRMPQLEGEPKP